MDLGFPLGLEEDISQFLVPKKVPFAAGDVLALFPDGITEAENSQGIRYGLERLCACLQKNYQLPVEDIKRAILTDLKQFIGQQKSYDDITLAIMKKTPETVLVTAGSLRAL